LNQERVAPSYNPNWQAGARNIQNLNMRRAAYRLERQMRNRMVNADMAEVGIDEFGDMQDI